MWRRRPRLAVLAGFAALALATVAITGFGATLTPEYGSLAPYRQSAAVDLRQPPHARGWTTDLARSILPGVPVRCVSFASSPSSGRYVLLTGAGQPLGSSTGCSSLTAAQVESTLALVDGKTGRVPWTVDLRQVFPSSRDDLTVQQLSFVPEAARVLVLASVGGGFRLATLSLATGRVTASVDLERDAVGQAPETAGTLVLYSSSSSREGSAVWTLVDARRLDDPLWTAVLPDAVTPWLTRSAVFTTLDGRSVRIDGETGRITDFGGGDVSLTTAAADDDGLYTTRVLTSGEILTAWSASGRRLWSRSGIGDISGISRDCVVASLPGTTKLTCLDRSDGRTRWTTDVGSLAYAYYLPGQTTDDVPVYRSSRNQIEVLMLDGATGRHEYALRLPAQSQIVAVSRTTGYLRTSSETGTATGITAFDMRTGRTLWARTAEADGDTELWGGQLVSVGKDQVARQLGGHPPLVLGD